MTSTRAVEWLSPTEAATHTGFSEKTLRNRRAKGLRPRYHKVCNRVRYARAELDDWISSNGHEPPKRGRPRKTP